MASRLLVALIGIPLLLGVLIFSPPIGLAVAIGVLSAIGVYELLWQTGYVKHFVLLSVSALVGAAVPFWVYFNCNIIAAVAVMLLYLIVLFSAAFASHETVTLGEIGASVFAGVVIPALFSTILLLADLDHYRCFTLLPFIAAFGSDSAALFFGMTLGKHKLAPVLSPHKTVEGAIGGVVGATLLCAVYGVLLRVFFQISANYAVLLAFGLLGSVVSQFGDLTFSYIKRQFELKDYGHLFLNHGGVLDRFDSVIFCAPLAVVMAYTLTFFRF